MPGTRQIAPALLAAALCAAAACVPEYEDRPSLLRDDAVLAVVGEPPEAAPGGAVAYSLLVAGPGGAVVPDGARWSFCAAPKPLTENNAVSAACAAGEALVPFGDGAAATASIPGDACALHGPQTPPGQFRPRDPDPTGGFYQPVRVDLGDSVSFGAERIRCGLAAAPVDIARDFAASYVLNVNPILSPLRALSEDGEPADVDRVSAGSDIDLLASWPSGSAETYVHHDREAQRLTTRREAMSVSWFATAGELASDRTGRSEEDERTSTTNRFRAPDEPGPVHLFLVLRDSRGGAAWLDHLIEVVP